MSRSVVLIASSALLLPAAVVVAPAEAASTRPSNHESYVVRNCSTTKSGVALRIKFRVDSLESGRVYRIRVSHPDGTGRFDEPRVRRTHSGFIAGLSNPDGGVNLFPQGDRPVFRGQGRGPDAILTTFKLRNGKSTDLRCKSPLL